MDLRGWAEIALTLGLSVGVAWPLGLYMARIWAGETTWLTPVLNPVERGIYRVLGVRPEQSQGWKGYSFSVIAFSVAGFVLLYALLRLQGFLPLNPAGFGNLDPHLAFNVAVSFVTNTNWQSYGGETTMSLLSQMAGLAVQNFTSAAAGLAIAAAAARAFAGDREVGLGNFWVDLVRITLYVLLPLSIVVALALVATGVPQTLHAAVTVTGLEGAQQTLALGPVASQEAIKQIGTNGGGFFNANSAHPFENPNPLSNLIEAVSITALGFATFIAFGRMARARKEAASLVIVAFLLVAAAAVAIYGLENQTVPGLLKAGVEAGQNLEGKEYRFGTAASALWSALTTGASNGSVNAMHESFMPLSGGIQMFLIQLGEILPGGVGSGLYGMLVMALLAVFVAGLMVGRTPEYLGKKVEAAEIQYAMLAVLILPLAILGFSALAAVLPAALSSLLTDGPHGLSEILYAYSSAGGNNGSAFAGLTAATPWWDTTLGIAMLLGRFGYIVPVMAILGSLAAKPRLAPTAGTLPASGRLFSGLLLGVILVLGGLQFFPALALGPLAEHFQLLASLRP
ncbi:potassium-transporting ATPase subunit KdpA [Radicibacter daui]|uniref:potassium-transporting ATPase subunit KdpA n=1 Tax=Radicibacter daui TaxID=3064829 RepID=UPI004046DB5B